MANASTDRQFDIELGARGSAMRDVTLRQSHTNRNAGPAALMSSSPESFREAQPSVSQDQGAGENDIRENTRPSRNPVANDQPDDPSEEPRMIGDFDSGADDLWSLYGKAAKSFDESLVNLALKEPMNDVFLFAGLFSAALTPFIIDSKQSLKVNPADQAVYYLQQHSVLLSQISQQISVIAPQVSIPSAPPPPFPAFQPSASDIHVNGLWLAALVSSLTAALLALITQRCAREYMSIFQRYNDPLKRARHRQYLLQGWLGWLLLLFAETPQAFLHLSLGFFFVGLGDVVLKIDSTIASGTIIYIGYCGLFYILSIILPLIWPQSPIRNPYSILMWIFRQILPGVARKYRDIDGVTKPVSANLVQAQLQLAMEETGGRKKRDVQAIQWLVGRLTDDADLDSLAKAIPGSFNVDWGLEVWNEVFHATLHSRSTTTRIQRNYQVIDLNVARLLRTCHTPRLFRDEREWQNRTRACVETTALLICCTGAELSWFGDITKLLGDIGRDQTTRKSSLEGEDKLFVTSWTCLSLMATCPSLEGRGSLQERARKALGLFQEGSITGNEVLDVSFPNAQWIDNKFCRAWENLDALYCALVVEEYMMEEQVVMVLRDHEHQISEVENIKREAESLRNIDRLMSDIESYIDTKSHGIITRYLPGVQSHFDDLQTEPTHPSRSVHSPLDPCKLQFIFPGQDLERICSLVSTFRDIHSGNWDADTYEEALKNLKTFIRIPAWKKNVVQQQIFRLLDLTDGGFGFTIELFFLALKPLLSTSPSRPHSTLYTGTFRVISFDWRNYKNSKGTQNFLLRMVLPDGGVIPSFSYPTYITDLFFLELLRNIFTGLSRYDQVEHAVRELRNINLSEYGTPAQQVFLDSVLGIFSNVL